MRATAACGLAKPAFLIRLVADKTSIVNGETCSVTENYQIFCNKFSRDKLDVGSRSEQSSTSPTSPQQRRVTVSSPASKRTKNAYDKDASFDPFERRIISFQTGEALLEIFKTKMTPYFPFVLFPSDVSIEELNSERPCACLAALAAASHADAATQKRLGIMFKEIVAARMVDGDFNQLDLMQGLLIHVAWYDIWHQYLRIC